MTMTQKLRYLNRPRNGYCILCERYHEL